MENSDTDRFFEGQEVKALYWEDDSQVEVGMGNVKKITVVMEPGQMGRVPWFAVWDDHCIIQKHNGALVATVLL